MSELFLFQDGPTGRGLVVDASGRLVATGDSGGPLFPFSFGQTGRTIVVDASGRIVLSPLSPGLGGSGTSGADSTSVVNLGSGLGVFSSEVGDEIRLKSLLAGSGIKLVSATNEIIINNELVDDLNNLENQVNNLPFIANSGAAVLSELSLLENDGLGNNILTLHAASSFAANFDLYLPTTIGKNQQMIKVNSSGEMSFDYKDDVANSFLITGSTPERWYWAPTCYITATPTSKTLAANTIYAFPLIISAGAIAFDKISFDVTTLAGVSETRVGLYSNTNRFLPYPDQLIVDGGGHSTATGSGTGYKTTSGLNINLSPGLYWAVILSNGVPALRALSNASFPLLGTPTTPIGTANMGVGWRTPLTYGALPSTFPATPATATIYTPITDAGSPAVMFRFTGESL